MEEEKMGEQLEEKIQKGYAVFGKAYEIMLRNDLHDRNSIDHQFLKEMILLTSDSYQLLYHDYPKRYDMKEHELYDFAQGLKAGTEQETVQKVVEYTSGIAKNYAIPNEEMIFGGTEKEILIRGTDWCSDMARVAAVLLDCLDIPSRVVHLVNYETAYNGHVVIEAFYEEKYGVADPIYGYCFYNNKPLDAYELMNNSLHFAGKDEDYRGLYKGIAINEYNPILKINNYSISRINEYYRKLLSVQHNGMWIMGEDGETGR